MTMAGLLTEAEAKKKWCPLARCGNESGANRSGTNNDFPAVPFCLGSACMAWRWETFEGTPFGAGDAQRGFCGAFGIPLEVYA